MVSNAILNWHALPVLLLTVATVAELCRRWRNTPWMQLATWTLRPWAAWAVFSLIFRWQHGDGFNNLRTFPFFANLWNETEPVWQTAAARAASPVTWCWTLAVLGLGAGLALLVRRVAARDEPSRTTTLLTLTATFLLAAALPVAAACLPHGARPRSPDQPGSLTWSWQAHSTVLYAIPLIESPDHFLSHFLEIQPDLRPTIHALSHPPAAALSLYWIGNALGAKDLDIRSEEARRRYLIGLVLFGATNVFVVYALGQRLFNSRRAGLTAAALWSAMPATLAYSTFAQDTVYSVFFNAALLLTWCAATARRGAAAWASLLGVVFFCLTMLNYSWCVAATIFALFAALTGLRAAWRPRDWAVRLILPLAIMTVLSGALLFHYRLDYCEAYRVAREYVGEWYRFESAYQWTMALVGGQMDLLLMAGGVTASAMAVVIWRLPREARVRPESLFLAVILCVYALPILFGPNALKMETARCWSWILSVPISFAAVTLLKHAAAKLFVPGAVAGSVGTYAIMRLFLNFAP